MSDRRQSIKQKIEQDHRRAMQILQAPSPAQWSSSVPSEQDAPWTARDLLAHLAASEAGVLGQIRRLLAGEQTVPPDFDLARWNRRAVQKQSAKSVSDLLSEIEAAHTEVLALVDTIRETDWDKRGRHALGDVLDVEGFLIRITEHRLAHCLELAAALGISA